MFAKSSENDNQCTSFSKSRRFNVMIFNIIVDVVNILSFVAIMDKITQVKDYCDNSYHITDGFGMFGCDGEISQCISDDKCYTPGDTFGFDYCTDSCKCCPDEDLYDYNGRSTGFLAISCICMFFTLIAMIFWRLENGKAPNCGEIIAFTALTIFRITDTFVNSINYISFLISKFSDYKLHKYSYNNCVILISIICNLLSLLVDLIYFKYYYYGQRGENTSNIEKKKNTRKVVLRRRSNRHASRHAHDANTSGMTPQDPEEKRQSVPFVVRRSSKTQNKNENTNNEQSRNEGELMRYLIDNKDNCLKITNCEWNHVSIFINKLKFSNQVEYNALLNQFVWLKDDSQSFFIVVKTIMDNNNFKVKEVNQADTCTGENYDSVYNYNSNYDYNDNNHEEQRDSAWTSQ